MATTPTPAPHVSWLKKLGQDFVKFLGIAVSVEKVAEPVVEAFLPASIPVFAVFDEVVGLVTTIEQTFAAVGQQSNGPAKLNAALAGTIQALEQYVKDKLPGSASILSSEQWLQARTGIATQYINTVVAFLNSLPPAAQTSAVAPAQTAASIAAVQAAEAALKSH